MEASRSTPDSWAATRILSLEAFVFHVATSIPFQDPFPTPALVNEVFPRALLILEQLWLESKMDYPYSPVLGAPPMLFAYVRQVALFYSQFRSQTLDVRQCQSLEEDLKRWSDDNNIADSYTVNVVDFADFADASLGLTCPSDRQDASQSFFGPKLYVLAARILLKLPQRQMFDIFGDSLRLNESSKPTPQNIERALTRLVDVMRARRMQTRPPPAADVVAALQFLFAVRAKNPQHLTRTETALIAEGLAHAQEQGLVLNDSVPVSLARQDLLNIFVALAQSDEGGRLHSDTRALADRVFQALRTYDGESDGKGDGTGDGEGKGGGDDEGKGGVDGEGKGSLEEALRLLRTVQGVGQEQLVPAWLAVLKNELRPAAFQKLLDEFHQRVGALSPSAHEDLVRFAASQGRVGLCKELLDYKFQSREPLTTAALAHILKLCIEKRQRNLASHCAEALLGRADISASSMAVLLLWYAAESPTTRLLQQKMVELQDRGCTEAISIDTFNMLLDYAYRNNDAERAQKYLELANFFGVRADAASHALKLQYELSRDDVAAAITAFLAMANDDVPRDRADVPAMNKLLQKLSSAPEPQYGLIMRVVDRVIDTGADLDAETVAGLCSVFLQHNDSEQLAGLVRYRVDAFSQAERARIIAVFKDFITDRKTADQLAWNTYDMLRNAFPEISVADQLQIMDNFFERDKPEFATLVFTHMHQRTEPQLRPDADAYAQCLFGVARCRDVDGLQLVYNMLKLDRTVEQTTKIRNALMAAYTACRMPYTSIIDHWWKILDSRDGPTLSSFLLALRACETWVPFGSLEARRILALAQSWNMLISKDLYEAYIGAIAGQSEFENAVELIEHMHDDTGETPDARTIGIFYNAIPWQYRKDEVERWARRAFPALWAELESWGDVIDEDWEVRYFNVDRTIDVDDDLLFPPGHYTRDLAERARCTALRIQ
ncbi:hypothetical protein DV737_g2419, partial [Chaetothyriales sp. CBS 132003]